MCVHHKKPQERGEEQNGKKKKRKESETKRGRGWQSARRVGLLGSILHLRCDDVIESKLRRERRSWERNTSVCLFSDREEVVRQSVSHIHLAGKKKAPIFNEGAITMSN